MDEIDFNLMCAMYAILVEQNNAIWDKISGKENLSDQRVQKLIPLMNKLEKEIEKRLGTKWES